MPAKSQSVGLKRGVAAPERDGVGRGHVTDIQRARMVAAMIDVVSERGRSNATVAHVVSRSGVSRRTFYEVFVDFEDCFLAALDRSIACASQYVLGAYDPARKWRVRIGSALVGLLEFLEDEPGMGRLCIVETLGAGPRVHERRATVLDAVIAAIDEGRLESRSTKTLPSLTSEGIVGGVLSVLHARLLAPSGASAGDVPDRLPSNREASADGHESSQRAARTDEHEQAGRGRYPLLELTGALMGMIVLPYLGPAAAAKESARPTPERRSRLRRASTDPLRDLEMRLTYRTVRVLLAIAAAPRASNREVGVAAGIDDQGQISKLLSRLEKLGLIENSGGGQIRGAPNAWMLTKKGVEVEQLMIGTQR
jgi:AcrR family transcriptional regulator